MAETMFERYGGFAKVSRVVASFYGKVLDSPILEPYFSDVDMRRLMDHQTKFIAFLMGGPASYTSEHLARVHERLAITDEAFDEMTSLLRETFEDFDFDESDISTLHSKVTSYRPIIVIQPAAVLDPSEPR
jgi:hemoglobin